MLQTSLFTNKLKLLAGTMLCSLLVSTASAHLSGRVYCIDGGNQTGLGGVTVTSCAGSVITDSAGNYVFSAVASGECEVCVTVPANCVGDRCITITVTDFAENNGVDFSFTG